MAMTIKQLDIKKKYDVSSFKPKLSFEEFREYYIRRLRERLSDIIYYENEDGTEGKLEPINHYPELYEYEVWMEGYAATGEHSSAQLIGKAKARNFAQACHILFAQSFLENTAEINSPEWASKPKHKQYVTPGRWYYDGINLSWWGQNLFWSEKLARLSYG